MKLKFFFICIVLSVCLLSGCRHVEYVAVPEVRYVHSTDTVHDSIDRWHTHYEYLKGDTLHSIDTFYRDRWHWERSTDTLTEFIPVVDTAATNALKAELAAVQQQSADRARRLRGWLIGISIFAVVLLVPFVIRLIRRLNPTLLWRRITTD